MLTVPRESKECVVPLGVSIVSCLRILNNSVKEQTVFHLYRKKTEIGGARGTHGRTRVAYWFFVGRPVVTLCFIRLHCVSLCTVLLHVMGLHFIGSTFCRLTRYRTTRWPLHVYVYMFPTNFRSTVYNPESYWSDFYRPACQALRVIRLPIISLHIKAVHVEAMHITRPNIAFYSTAYCRPAMLKGYML
jgi:hypothetical protein